MKELDERRYKIIKSLRNKEWKRKENKNFV